MERARYSSGRKISHPVAVAPTRSSPSHKTSQWVNPFGVGSRSTGVDCSRLSEQYIESQVHERAARNVRFCPTRLSSPILQKVESARGIYVWVRAMCHDADVGTYNETLISL